MANKPAGLRTGPLGRWLNLNDASGVPIYRQLADQVKYLILRGELSDGTRLPSAQHLAANLGINRNTVLNAYSLLAGEGYVEGRRGGGTVVVGRANAASKANVDQQLLSMIDSAVTRAEQLGMDYQELASLIAAHAGVRIQSLCGLSVVFVECNTSSLTHFVRSLRDEFDGISVEGLLLAQLESESAQETLHSADCIVSTFFHLSEVRRALRSLEQTNELFAIGVRPHITVLEELERLPKGSVVGIAYLAEDEDNTTDRLLRMTEALSGTNLRGIVFRPILVDGDSPTLLFAGVDAVLIRPENIAAVRSAIPSEVRVIEFVNVMDGASRRFLSEVFADLRSRRLDHGG